MVFGRAVHTTPSKGSPCYCTAGTGGGVVGTGPESMSVYWEEEMGCLGQKMVD